MLAPCTKMNVLEGTMGYHYYNDMVDQIDMIGLYGLHGLNWEQFKPEVCAHLGRQWCDQQTVWAEEPISARALSHFFQMGIEGRFQEYAESYLQGKQHRITADIPIQNIAHTPIAVMYGDADRVCPMDSVEWMMGTIGHMVYGNYQFGGYDHADFGKANDQVFMGELHEALSHLQPHDLHYTPEERLEEDIAHALLEEYHHEREADLEHERDVEAMHEHGYGEPIHHYEHEHEHEVMHHLPEMHYGPQAHDLHEVASEDDKASWRDDKYQGHAGFDLSPRHHEAAYESEGHHAAAYGHHESYLQ